MTLVNTQTRGLSTEVVTDLERRRKTRNHAGNSQRLIRQGGRISELKLNEGRGVVSRRYERAALPSDTKTE